MKRLAWFLLAVMAWTGPVWALDEPAGLVTQKSAYSVRVTLDRFADAVRSSGWVVFTEIDHADAARLAGLALAPRVVVVFGNPKGGTAAMGAHPTLAIDLPMRVLVWADDAGKVFVTRSTGADIAHRVFARHGMDIGDDGQIATDRMFAALVRQASE